MALFILKSNRAQFMSHCALEWVYAQVGSPGGYWQDIAGVGASGFGEFPTKLQSLCKLCGTKVTLPGVAACNVF